MNDDVSGRLAKNIKQLREARGFTQQQMAELAELPRATWANLETGAANPTLHVLQRVAHALQVTMEELVANPRAEAKRFPKGTLPVRTQGPVTVQRLLPDPIPGMEIDRIELPHRSRLTGVPHTPGAREYLTCESGRMVLVVAGEKWELDVGDVVAFRGDQRHSYLNDGPGTAIGYSVVVLARVS